MKGTVAIFFIGLFYLYVIEPHAADTGVRFIYDTIVTNPSIVLAVLSTIFILTAIFIGVKDKL
jgi:hypothetical protein